jgi:hypothetical protein
MKIDKKKELKYRYIRGRNNEVTGELYLNEKLMGTFITKPRGHLFISLGGKRETRWFEKWDDFSKFNYHYIEVA